MATAEFTVADLRRILHEAAGADGSTDVDPSTLDTAFSELGYESLALLETGSRIGRELGITLEDSTMFDATTPRVLIAAVNAQLATREADHGADHGATREADREAARGGGPSA